MSHLQQKLRNPKKNENQIEKFLKNYKNFNLVSIKDRIKKTFLESSVLMNKNGYTLTPNTLNTDGYFITILKRAS